MVRKVRLKGKTLHGKTRIHQHGEIWEVLQPTSRGTHSRLELQSLNKTMGGFSDGRRVKDRRWVHPTNDFNFEVIEIDA